MTDRYEKIRKALAKRPMQGPWGATLRDLLAERDAQAAEIEALRAEVERLSALLGQTEHSLADIANAQYLRAERLAEVLREAQPFIGWTGSYPELHAKIDALLREQEEGK